MKPTLSKSQTVVILIAILSLALLLRLYKINDHGIWLDEKTTIRSAVGIKDFKHIYNQQIYNHIPTDELKVNDVVLSKQPFVASDYWLKNNLHNVKNAIVLDNSNSLIYAVVLHYWVGLFGPSDLSGRLFSTLFGLLTLLLAYYLARNYIPDSRYALALVLLLACNCWLILNCQLLRTYAFTTFFSLLCTVLFFEIIFGNKGLWHYVGYGFAALVALGGHHMVLYLFVAHGLIALLFLRNRKAWMGLIAIAIPVLVIYSLWVTKYGAAGFEVLKWKNIELASRAVSRPQDVFPGVPTPKNLFGGVVNYLNMIFGTHMLFFGLRIYMVLGLLLIPGGLIAIVYSKTPRQQVRQVLASCCIIIAASPMFSMFMAFRSHTAVPFTIFYAAYAVPIGAFVLMLCFSQIGGLNGLYLKVTLLFATIQVLLVLVSFTTAYKEVMVNGQTPNPYMGIASKIKTDYKPGDIVIYPAWEDAQLTDLYLKGRDDIKQAVDTTLHDKVILLKGDQRAQIFDFENGKYRY